MVYPKFKIGPTKRFTKYVGGDIVQDQQGNKFKIVALDARGTQYYILNLTTNANSWIGISDFNAITSFVDRSNETI